MRNGKHKHKHKIVEVDLGEKIPGVVHDFRIDPETEEPYLLRTVIQPSPVPRWLAVLLILLAAASTAEVFISRAQVRSDVHDRLKAQQKQINTNTTFAHRLQGDENTLSDAQIRLNQLVQNVLIARTPQELKKALKAFERASVAAQKERVSGNTVSPSSITATQAPSAPAGKTQPTSKPRATPTVTVTATRTKTAQPTSSPTSQPDPIKSLVCGITNPLLGRCPLPASSISFAYPVQSDQETLLCIVTVPVGSLEADPAARALADQPALLVEPANSVDSQVRYVELRCLSS